MPHATNATRPASAQQKASQSAEPGRSVNVDALRVGVAESLLLTPENRFAVTALDDLLHRPHSWSSRLVFLYGPSGAGKSHLIRHALRIVRKENPRVRIVETTAAEFAARLAEASQEGTFDLFRESFISAEIFVCEDIACLAQRRETQIQLNVLLDAIAAAGGSCIFSGDRPPGEMNGLSHRLINRFHGGVCAGIALPALESRRRLVEHFAQVHQVPLAGEIAALVARELAVSPRELYASVLQLEMRARAGRSHIDARLVQTLLREEPQRASPTLSRIARTVARHFGVTVGAIRSATRCRVQVIPRHCAMYLSRELTDASLEAIAAFFSRRNHSTVSHACERIGARLANDAGLRRQLAQIRHALGATEVSRCEKHVEGTLKTGR